MSEENNNNNDDNFLESFIEEMAEKFDYVADRFPKPFDQII